MKDNIYKSTIAVLVVVLGFSIYLLYNKDASVKSLENEKTTNIKDMTNLEDQTSMNMKNQANNKQRQMKPYTPKNIDSSKIDANIKDLNEMLSKTKEMLKSYNNNNNLNKIISNEEIDKLLDLDSLPNEHVLEKLSKKLSQSEKTTNNSNSFSVSSNNKTTEKSSVDDSPKTPSGQTNPVPTPTSPSEINPEITELKAQIDSIKKTINNMNINQ